VKKDMPVSQPTSSQPTPLELAATLTEQALLARATELARAGDYAQADGLLDKLAVGGRESAPALDLAARMAAQRGRLAQARAVWRRALELAPGEEAYRTALQRVEAVSSNKLLGLWLRTHSWRGVIIAAIVVVACLAVVQTWRTARLATLTSVTPAATASLVAVLPVPTITPAPQPTTAPTARATAVPTAVPLAEQAQAQLAAAQAEVGANIQAAERSGVIYLTGQVPSIVACDAAIKQVKNIPGVLGVDTAALEIVPPELTAEIERALASQDGGLRFQIVGAGVKLIGTVIGEPGLRAVISALRQVPGVAWVDSIQVLIEPLYRSYTVNRGDSLASIALAELGDADAWPMIFDLNRDLIADPNLIRPSMVLKLPRR
jgi:nucleoid-associated protein YgaU